MEQKTLEWFLEANWLKIPELGRVKSDVEILVRNAQPPSVAKEALIIVCDGGRTGEVSHYWIKYYGRERDPIGKECYRITGDAITKLLVKK